MNHSVSVMLPTYNHAQWLMRALLSLENQTFKDFQVVVVNDGSTDATSAILQQWIRKTDLAALVMNQANGGTAAAINECATHCDGRFWTWVSSDNIMYPKWLETLVRQMAEGVGAAYSAFRFIPEGAPQRAKIKREAYFPDKLLQGEQCYYGPSFLIHSDIWKIAGPHRGLGSHDYDHWTRVEEACMVIGQRIVYVDEVLCDYYSGPWGTVRRDPAKYDAPKWRLEAIQRRKEYQP